MEEVHSPASVRRIYDSVYTPQERRELGKALEAVDLSAEVSLLRVLIERSVLAGESVDTVSRAIARLGQMLRVQHVLTGDAARGLDEALSRVLSEIGSEMGA